MPGWVRPTFQGGSRFERLPPFQAWSCVRRGGDGEPTARRPTSGGPLLCPYCGSEMRIVAFVVEVSSLRRLREGVGVGPQEAEPLSRAPPGGAGVRVGRGLEPDPGGGPWRSCVGVRGLGPLRGSVCSSGAVDGRIRRGELCGSASRGSPSLLGQPPVLRQARGLESELLPADGRIRLSFTNDRPNQLEVSVKARRRGSG